MRTTALAAGRGDQVSERWTCGDCGTRTRLATCPMCDSDPETTCDECGHVSSGEWSICPECATCLHPDSPGDRMDCGRDPCRFPKSREAHASREQVSGNKQEGTA